LRKDYKQKKSLSPLYTLRAAAFSPSASAYLWAERL